MDGITTHHYKHNGGTCLFSPARGRLCNKLKGNDIIAPGEDDRTANKQSQPYDLISQRALRHSEGKSEDVRERETRIDRKKEQEGSINGRVAMLRHSVT